MLNYQRDLNMTFGDIVDGKIGLQVRDNRIFVQKWDPPIMWPQGRVSSISGPVFFSDWTM